MRPSLMLVAVALVFAASAALADQEDKVRICHVPPGNPLAAHVIMVGESALPAHVGDDGHGDISIGFVPVCACPCFGELRECQSRCDDTNDSDDPCGCFRVYGGCVERACE